MIASVHLIVGATVGAICAHSAQKAPYKFSTPLLVEWFALGSVICALGLYSHFLCDFNNHSEYRQFEWWVLPLVLYIDLRIAIVLARYLFNKKYSPTDRACVAAGIFWASVPDGIFWSHELFGFSSAWTQAIQNVHQAIHVPAPSEGIFNQLVIVLVSAWLLQRILPHPT
ncbi:MAG: hypothetical protein AAB638_03455 [Patescibacteria group bacterium]